MYIHSFKAKIGIVFRDHTELTSCFVRFGCCACKYIERFEFPIFQ